MSAPTLNQCAKSACRLRTRRWETSRPCRAGNGLIYRGENRRVYDARFEASPQRHDFYRPKMKSAPSKSERENPPQTTLHISICSLISAILHLHLRPKGIQPSLLLDMNGVMQRCFSASILSSSSSEPSAHQVRFQSCDFHANTTLCDLDRRLAEPILLT